MASDLGNLVAPTVHRDGTSLDALLEQLDTAIRAISAAYDALALAAPNGRDYYPQGPDAIHTAVRQHYQRANSLREAHTQLSAIYVHLIDSYLPSPGIEDD